MKALRRAMNKPAVYWPPSGSRPDGQPSFGPPQQLRVRWVDETGQAVAPDGRTLTTRAKLYTPIPLKLGGYVCPGHLVAMTSSADPLQNVGAWEVVKVCAVPAPDGRWTLYEACL